MEEKYRYFKVILDCGHLGMGNSVEVTRYVRAKNCVDAFALGNRMPRVKRKREKTGTMRVMEISYSEYCVGQETESDTLYLNIYKPRKCG
ncbi:MAG TPA: hypothetical protein DCZ10_12770 [Pelotomaculum sp.]|nr:hypothetical protein [Pelotomaculum sp.]